MKQSLDEYIRASFIEASNMAMRALADLAGYNHSDSPPFSQVHGLQRYIDELQNELTEDEAAKRVGVRFERMAAILMDVSQSDAWDGAPVEVVREAREAWKDFVAYLKLSKNRFS